MALPRESKEHEKLNWAHESCRVIKDKAVFAVCHKYVNPEQFYQMCLQVFKIKHQTTDDLSP